MVLLKALTVIVFGVLTLLAIRHVRQVEAARVRVRVRAKAQRDPHAMRRLRQDPRTGIYYPAD